MNCKVEKEYPLVWFLLHKSSFISFKEEEKIILRNKIKNKKTFSIHKDVHKMSLKKICPKKTKSNFIHIVTQIEMSDLYLF